MKNYLTYKISTTVQACLLVFILFLLLIIKQASAQIIENDSVTGGCDARFVSTQTTSICPTGALCILPDHVNATFVALQKHQKYSWDFGDGQKGEGSPVSHLYFKPGKYKVTLTVFSPYVPYGTDGPALQVICYNTYSQIITITDSIAPQSNANCDINLHYTQKNNQVRVYDQNSMNKIAIAGVQDYFFWSFGDGNSSTEKFPTHTYSTSGKYVISLTKVSMNNIPNDTSSKACTKILSAEGSAIKVPCYFTEICRNTSKLTIVVNYPSDSNWCLSDIQYDVSGTKLAARDAINKITEYRPEILEHYYWDFGDGNTAVGQKIIHNYAKSGHYKVSVTKVVLNQSRMLSKDSSFRCESIFDKSIQLSYNRCIDIICKTTQYFTVTIPPSMPTDTSWICNKKLYAYSSENYQVHFSDGRMTLDAIPENPMYKSFYRFDFGDNTDSTANTMYLTHQYLPGKYKVKLIHKTFLDPTVKDSTIAVCLAFHYDEDLKTMIPCYFSLLCQSIQEIEINITESGKLRIDLPITGISPNPIENRGSVIIENSKSPVDLSIYNNAGILVKQILQIEEGISNFSVEDLPNGIYIYTISSQDQLLKRDKFSIIK